MWGNLAVVVSLMLAGVSAYAGEPGIPARPQVTQAFGSAPLSLSVEEPESVSIQSPGERVVYVEAPKATWGGLFRALVGFPFRVGAAVLRETGDTSAAVVEAGAGYAGAIGGEVVELEK